MGAQEIFIHVVLQPWGSPWQAQTLAFPAGRPGWAPKSSYFYLTLVPGTVLGVLPALPQAMLLICQQGDSGSERSGYLPKVTEPVSDTGI